MGRTVVITGAGRGVGYFVAEQLAVAGAHVIITTRGAPDVALERLRLAAPDAQVRVVRLDVASLESIRTAAVELSAVGPIDVLVNNAGKTSGSRSREVTADGFEIMVGTNALGPFALTAHLWPALAPDARVIGLGSLSTRLSKADLSDLQGERRYSLSRAYALSKHLVHGFAFELDRRLRAAASERMSLLAHPGFALDVNAALRPGITDLISPPRRVGENLLRPITQGKDRGAWPIVRAAVDPDAMGGEFYGPRRSVVGRPVTVKPTSQSADPAFGAEAWRLCEEATGVTFDV